MKNLFFSRSLQSGIGTDPVSVGSGSRVSPSQPGTYRQRRVLVVDGDIRRYLLYVPAGYSARKSVPLVISLHGHSGWPANQEKVSGWDELAERYGFIVAYPMGSGMPLQWRDSGNDESEKDIDFMADLIDALKAEYAIDPARIYVNGHSNGGGMAFMLTCKLEDRIAAFGSVAGGYLFPWKKYQNSHPVPFIAFHGTEDPVVPYTGGPSGEFALPFPDVRQWIREYAIHNGCMNIPVLNEIHQNVMREQYSGFQKGAEAILYTINGSGHGWPGSNAIMPKFIVGPTSNAIDATEVMWQFFSDHSLNR